MIEYNKNNKTFSVIEDTKSESLTDNSIIDILGKLVTPISIEECKNRIVEYFKLLKYPVNKFMDLINQYFDDTIKVYKKYGSVPDFNESQLVGSVVDLSEKLNLPCYKSNLKVWESYE